MSPRVLPYLAQQLVRRALTVDYRALAKRAAIDACVAAGVWVLRPRRDSRRP